MNNLQTLLENRWSVRAYDTARAVEPEKLAYILECARLAPSAVNRQPWRFIVVRSAAKRRELQACYDRPWFAEAPLYIVVCADTGASWKRPCDGRDHADVDAAIAAEHICLAAAEQGLGTCWVCNFDREGCEAMLGLPAAIRPVAIFPIGYAAPGSAAPEKSRKPAESLVTEI